MKAASDPHLFQKLAEDARRSSARAPWRWISAGATLLVSLTLTATLGVRDWRGDAPWLILGFAVLTTVLLSGFWLAASSRGARRSARVINLGSQMLGLAFTLAPIGATVPSMRHTVSDEWSCFLFGSITGLAALGTTLAITFRQGALLDPAARQQLSLSVAFSGVLALFLHCPQVDWPHVVTAHWGYLAMFTALSFGSFTVLTHLRLRQLVSPSVRKFL